MRKIKRKTLVETLKKRNPGDSPTHVFFPMFPTYLKAWLTMESKVRGVERNDMLMLIFQDWLVFHPLNSFDIKDMFVDGPEYDIKTNFRLANLDLKIKRLITAQAGLNDMLVWKYMAVMFKWWMERYALIVFEPEKFERLKFWKYDKRWPDEKK